MIHAIDINKRFGKLQALNNISLTCQKGQSIALIGPNGSGKTTFIKCLLGMTKPDSGAISFDGKDIAHEWRYRASIGYMPQTGRYPENMTIAQIIDMMKDIRRGNTPFNKSRNVDDAHSTDEGLIHAFGLHRILDKRMRTLSGGTRQKVSACLAFLFKPEVLILDEPTAGLDPVASEILKEKIREEKQKGKLILITSHILSELDDIVSEVIYLQDGKLRFHKSLQQLKTDTGEDKLVRAIARVMQTAEL
jgi:Cu-processing system ATP-binding protein